MFVFCLFVVWFVFDFLDVDAHVSFFVSVLFCCWVFVHGRRLKLGFICHVCVCSKCVLLLCWWGHFILTTSKSVRSLCCVCSVVPRDLRFCLLCLMLCFVDGYCLFGLCSCFALCVLIVVCLFVAWFVFVFIESYFHYVGGMLYLLCCVVVGCLFNVVYKRGLFALCVFVESACC